MASTLIAQSLAVRVPAAGHGVRSGLGLGLQSRRGAVAVPPVVRWSGSKLQAARVAKKCVEGCNFGGSLLMGESLWKQADLQASARTTCAAGIYVYNGISVETVRWCVAAALTVLLLKRDAGAKKQFWAGILVLEAPRDWVYWAKSEYGLWVAGLALAAKLFYSIPPELDYPLSVYLLITTLPAQALAQRGTTGATIVSLALAVFVAFQYFSNTVRLSDAFKSEHLLNTVLITFTAVAVAWFFGLTVL